MSLITASEAKEFMGVTTTNHDAEIERYCAAALGVVESMAGPTLLRREFVERRPAGVTLLLSRYPVVSVTSLGLLSGGTVSLHDNPDAFWVVNGEAGSITSPYVYGDVEVTYVAGLEQVPDEAVDAALTYVSYKYRRNHGGSESYMPSGVDGGIAPPMGTSALREQIRLALGPYARGSLLA